MIEPLIQQIQECNATPLPEHKQDAAVFRDTLDWMANGANFEHARLNAVALSVSKLCFNGYVQLCPAGDPNNPDIQFDPRLAAKDSASLPQVLLPNGLARNFIAEPVFAVSSIYSAAERIRCHFSARTPDRARTMAGQDSTKARMAAMGAEAALALTAPKNSEKIGMDVPPALKSVLEEYPRGYQSLPNIFSNEHTPIPAMPDLTSVQANFVGRLDYKALAIPKMLSLKSLAELALDWSQVASPDLVERALRGINSPLFLLALKAEHLPHEVEQARDPVTGQTTDYGLYAVTTSTDTLPSPGRLLNDVGINYEKNLHNLKSAGFFVPKEKFSRRKGRR